MSEVIELDYIASSFLFSCCLAGCLEMMSKFSLLFLLEFLNNSSVVEN